MMTKTAVHCLIFLAITGVALGLQPQGFETIQLNMRSTYVDFKEDGAETHYAIEVVDPVLRPGERAEQKTTRRLKFIEGVGKRRGVTLDLGDDGAWQMKQDPAGKTLSHQFRLLKVTYHDVDGDAAIDVIHDRRKDKEVWLIVTADAFVPVKEAALDAAGKPQTVSSLDGARRYEFRNGAWSLLP